MNDTSEWLERIAGEMLNDGAPDSLREYDDAPLLEWVALLSADFGDVCRATDGRDCRYALRRVAKTALAFAKRLDEGAFDVPA